MIQTNSIIVTKPNSTSAEINMGSLIPLKSEWNDSNDIPLFVDCWEGRQNTTNRVLIVVHGLGEHGGRYKHLPQFLGEQFDRFYAMDQRGHGRSQGMRGYAPNFEAFLEDLKRVAADVREREPGKKLYLLAHSFGVLVALSYLVRERKVPFERAIISAPLLGVAMKVPAFKIMLGKFLGKTLPKFQLSNEINPSFLSHDPAIVEAYVNDRLVHNKITPRLYLEMTAAMEKLCASHGPLACPTLFLIPKQDRIVDSSTTLRFFRDVKYREKELREYPEMYHEILNEVDKQTVFSDIKSWLGSN